MASGGTTLEGSTMPSGGGGTQTVRSELPPEYEQFANENLTLAGTMANSPYIQYGGQRIAGFGADQNLGFGMARDAASAYQPMLDQSNAAFQSLADGSADVTARQGSEFISDYTNPHENTVVNNLIGDMGRGLNIGLGALGGRAAGNGAYGGSRHGIAEGEMGREFFDRLGSTVGQVRQAGFNTAVGAGQNDANRFLSADQGNQSTRLSAAQGMAQNAQLAQNLGFAGAQGLLNTGGMQQGMDQANLDLGYQDFIDQQNHPLRMMALRQSALGQTPMGSIQRTPTQSNMGGMLSGVGGLLGGIASIANIPCWVAREVYGEDDPRWLRFRDALLDNASDDVLMTYAAHGEDYAEHLRTHPEEKARMRALMDSVLEAA